MAEQEFRSPDVVLKEEEVNGIAESYESGGSNKMMQYILARLNGWKSTKINIAVTGNRGVGKSSVINALRNVKPGKSGAAEVGATQTTKKVTAYEFPKNENVVLWDLPGVGTTNFPRGTYKDRMKLERYDAYIIVSAEAFTEDDAWLIREAISKRYFMVRTKIDAAIRDEQNDNNLTEKQTLQKVRKYCQRSIGSMEQVYLISAREPDRHRYDFSMLCTALAFTIDGSRNGALLFSLSASGKDLIAAKKETLKSRITKVAIASAVAGFIPIPGIETLVDSAILLGEIKFYIEQFELTEEALINLSAEIKEPTSAMKRRLETPKLDISISGLAQYFDDNDRSTKFEKVAKYITPVIGSFISSKKSFVACVNCLSALLDMASRDALKTVQMRIEHNAT